MADAAVLMRTSAALREEASRQRAMRLADLDFDALALAAVRAIRDEPPTNPIDPEGDGLETRELNAANDL